MKDLSFIEVTAAEAEDVASLARAIWPIVYSDMISREQINYMLDWMYDPAKIREEIQSSGITWLFITLRSENVGFLAFGPVSPGTTCFIHKIYVSPNHQRKGIGSAALDEIEQRATKHEASAMELRVNRSNESAIGLYQKAGFQIIAEDCADIGNGFVMDDYIFQKAIDQLPR